MKRFKKTKKYAIGSVIGAGMSIGDMIGTPIRQRAEEIDPYTGEYLDMNKAVRNAGAGSIWAPHKAITASLSDPNATGGEKALSFTSLLGIPGLSKMWAKKRYSRLEEENKNKAFLTQHPNTLGESYNPYYMAKGGLIPAELEDGEVYRTPGGQLEEVNGNTHAEGGEMFMLPEGTGILGKNTSKEYGEKFKEVGQRLKRMQDKHNKIMDSHQPMIAKGTSKRMLDKIQMQFDNLMSEQEQAKILEDTVGVYAKGGSIYIKPSHRGRFTKWAKRHGMSVSQAASHVMANKEKYSGGVVKMANLARNAKKFKHGGGDWLTKYGLTVPKIPQETPREWFSPIQKYEYNFFGTQGKISNPVAQQNKINKVSGTVPSSVTHSAPIAAVTPQPVNTVNRPIPISQTIDPFARYKTNYMTGMPSSQTNAKTWVNPGTSKSSVLGSIGNIAQGISEFAPIAYNIGQGLSKEPQFNYQQYLNPYIANIRGAMRKRRYNIDPELESNRLAQAVYNRNLRTAGASPSQLQGGLQAGAISRMRGDASTRAQEQNINNQYLGQQAEMDYNLGRDIAGTKLTGYDINQRNKSASRNFMATAMSQLQQLGQAKKLEQNQVYRDAQRLGLLKDLFSDFSYTDQGWIFNKDGSSASNFDVMKYLKGKR